MNILSPPHCKIDNGQLTIDNCGVAYATIENRFASHREIVCRIVRYHPKTYFVYFEGVNGRARQARSDESLLHIEFHPIYYCICPGKSMRFSPKIFKKSIPLPRIGKWTMDNGQWTTHNVCSSVSLRTSAHTGVAISRKMYN